MASVSRGRGRWLLLLKESKMGGLPSSTSACWLHLLTPVAEGGPGRRGIKGGSLLAESCRDQSEQESERVAEAEQRKKPLGLESVMVIILGRLKGNSAAEDEGADSEDEEEDAGEEDGALACSESTTGWRLPEFAEDPPPPPPPNPKRLAPSLPPRNICCCCCCCCC